MISGTYLLSGVLLAISALLFNAGALERGDADGLLVRHLLLRLGRCVLGLPDRERDLPVEVRAKAIAVFFAIAQSFGAFGPWLYGELIGNGHDHFRLFIGVPDRRRGDGRRRAGRCLPRYRCRAKSLEDIAQPLSATRPSSHLSAVTGAPWPPAARSTLA